MAELEIVLSDLPAKPSLLDSDIIPVDDGAQTYRVTGAQLREFLKVNFLSVGTVVLSQSDKAIGNPGRLPLWTGEYIVNASALYPDLYSFVKADARRHVTKAAYDNQITATGECKYYVADEVEGSLRLPKYRTKTKYIDYTDGVVFCNNAAVDNPVSYTAPVNGMVAVAANGSYMNSLTIKINGTVQNSFGDDINGNTKETGGQYYLNAGDVITLIREVRADSFEWVRAQFFPEKTRGADITGPDWPWVFSNNASVPASTVQTAEFLQSLMNKSDKDLGNVASPTADFCSMSVSWIGPDYARPVTLASGVSYTADRCGWLLVAVSAVGIYSTCNLLVNGVQVMDFYATVASAPGHYATLLPVSKGDTYMGTGLSSMVFLPCKGDI